MHSRMSGTWAVTVGPRRMVGGRAAPAVAREEQFMVVGDADLSDALTEAYNSARADVNAQAGAYHLPQVPTTRPQAIMAYILLMRSAMSEHKSNVGYYKSRANEAAYKFANAQIDNIVQTAYDLTKGGAPRTAQVALSLLTQVKARTIRSSAAAKHTAKRRRRTVSSTPEYDVLVEDIPASESGSSWWPPSMPVAAGVAAALVGAAFLFGGRK